MVYRGERQPSPPRRGSSYNRSDHRPAYRSPDYRSDYRPDIDRYTSSSSKQPQFRNQSRDRAWDRDPDRDLDMDRRDSRDSNFYARDPRDSRDSRGRQSSPRHRGDTNAQRLQLDTGIPIGPKKLVSSTPTEPAAERMSKAPSKLGYPLIEDRELQDIFTAFYVWNETQHKHMSSRLQQDKLAQEDKHRKVELTKTAGKADFAPFSEFSRRFDESGKAEREKVDNKVDENRQECINDINKVAAAIRESVKSWVTSAVALNNSSATALEARFAEHLKQAAERDKQISEGQAQIQELLDDRKKSTELFNKLSQDVVSLKSGLDTVRCDHNKLQSEHTQLQSEHVQLRSSHDKLQSDYDRLRTSYDGVQSELDNLRSGRNKLRLEHDNVQSNNLKTLESKYNELQSRYSENELQITSLKSAKDADQGLNQLAEQVQSLVARVDSAEKHVSAFMRKVEEFDMETYNEILESWIDHDFKNKVLFTEKLAVSLEKNVKSLQESGARESNTSKQPASPLEEYSEQAAPQPSACTIGEAQKVVIDEKLNEFKKVMENITELSQEACADMIDELGKRMGAIEPKVIALDSKVTETAMKVDSLEQIMKQEVERWDAMYGALDVRVGSLEMRGSKTEFGLANLDKRTGEVVKGLRMDIEATKGRCEAVGFSVKQLDSQWTNLSSKQMAETILAQLDSHGQRNESRVVSVEMRLKLIEDIVKDVKLIEDMVKDLKQNSRSKLPDGRSSDPNKKRKLTDSGQSSPSFRNSSLGQNMERPT